MKVFFFSKVKIIKKGPDWGLSKNHFFLLNVVLAHYAIEPLEHQDQDDSCCHHESEVEVEEIFLLWEFFP